MQGFIEAINSLGEMLLAYKKRNAELEAENKHLSDELLLRHNEAPETLQRQVRGENG